MKEHQALLDLVGGTIPDLQFTIRKIKELKSISEDKHTLSALANYETAISLLVKVTNELRADYPELVE